MKRVSLIFALSATLIVIGCEKREPVQKVPKTFSTGTHEKTTDTSVFKTSEKDQFHRNSKIESAGKRRLTDFGRNTGHTFPDQTSASLEERVNGPGFDTLKIPLSNFMPLKSYTFPFDYENDIQALKRLYQEHGLDKILTDNLSQLGMARAIAQYTHNFLKDGTPPSADSWMNDTFPSAEMITKLKKEKNIGGLSDHYAALFCQLCLSCGMVARIVGMHTIGENGELLAHSVSEIYHNSLNKWIVIDPYEQATYYLRDNIPLSAYELRELMLKNHYEDIKPIVSAGDIADIYRVRENLLPRYENLYVWRMNDILSKSGRGKSITWQELFSSHLVWEDEYAAIADGGYERLNKFTSKDDPGHPLNGVRFVTHDVSEFNWAINNVIIDFKRLDNENIRIYLDTITPNFDHYVLNVENSGGSEPYRITGNQIDLNFLSMDIYVNSVNKLGYPGPMFHVVLSLL